MGTARLQALLWQTRDARTQAASQETAPPLMVSTSLCLSPPLSWKMLTSEIMMICETVTPCLIEIHIYIPQKMPLQKFKGRRKHKHSHTHTCICMSLHRYVYVGIYYISPSWHKSQEQKRPFVMSKGFSVQLLEPAGQAHQGGLNIDLCSLIKPRVSIGFLYGYLLQMLLIYLWSCQGKCLFAGSKCKFNSNKEYSAVPERTLYWGETHRSVMLFNHWHELGLFAAITDEKKKSNDGAHYLRLNPLKQS